MKPYIYGIFEYSFFDSYWSLIHFLSGSFIGLIILAKTKYLNKNYYAIGISLLFIFEVFEEFVLRNLKGHPWFQYLLDSLQIGFLFGKESNINICSDIILGTFGMFLVLHYFGNKNKRFKR